MNAKQTTKGFTIIEVVLVLAIAGLIFLMVFIALPALQSGQRDTARKNDVSAVSSAVNTFTSNNRGEWPTGSVDGDDTELFDYTQNLSDNTGAVGVEDYADSVTVSDNEIVVVKEARCESQGTTGAEAVSYNLESGTARQYVVVTRLEANNGSAFCQDS